MPEPADTPARRVTAIYCSACDRDVRVAFVPEGNPDPHVPLAEIDLVCLEIGDQCSGSLCPLDAKPEMPA